MLIYLLYNVCLFFSDVIRCLVLLLSYSTHAFIIRTRFVPPTLNCQPAESFMIRLHLLSDILYFAFFSLRIFKVEVPVELAGAQLAMAYSDTRQLISDAPMV